MNFYKLPWSNSFNIVIKFTIGIKLYLNSIYDSKKFLRFQFETLTHIILDQKQTKWPLTHKKKMAFQNIYNKWRQSCPRLFLLYFSKSIFLITFDVRPRNPRKNYLLTSILWVVVYDTHMHWYIKMMSYGLSKCVTGNSDVIIWACNFFFRGHHIHILKNWLVKMKFGMDYNHR